MVKKNHKKNVNAQKNFSQLNLNNSIMSSVVFWIVVIAAVVCGFVYRFSVTTIVSMQKQLPAEMIESLYVFNNQNQTASQFEAELPKLQEKLNQIIAKDYTIKDIVVTDDKFEEKYSSLNKKQDIYRYNVQGEPSTFKLMASGRYNVGNYRPLFIKKEINDVVNGKFITKTYYIHLIIPNGDDSQMQNLNTTAKYFFAAVLLISFLIALTVAKDIARPLSDMKEIVSKIGKGDLSGRLDYTNYYEINELVQSYNN